MVKRKDSENGLEIIPTPVGYDDSTIEKGTSGFKDFPKATAELIWNAFDWNGRRNTLTFFWRGDLICMSLLDDGDGASSGGRQALASYMRSEAAKDANKRGRIGNGRLGFIHHCLRCEYQTKTSDDPWLWEISFSKDELVGFLREGMAPWGRRRLRPDDDIKTTGLKITWVGLGAHLKGKSTHVRTPEAVIENVADLLAPYVTNTITVVNKLGDKPVVSKLVPRKLRGQLVQSDPKEVPGLGLVDYSIGVVQKSGNITDRLDVYAMGRVCSFIGFLEPLRKDKRYRTMVRHVEAILGHRDVVGYFNIPYCNRYATGARDRFDQDLYDDEDFIRALFRWLQTSICPPIEKALGFTAEQFSTADNHTLLEEVCSIAARGSGLVPVNPVNPDSNPSGKSAKSSRVINLEPGWKQILDAGDLEEGDKVEWSGDARKLGDLSSTSGQKVVFTARKPGNEVLTATIRNPGKEDTVRKWRIKVQLELRPTFTQPTLNLGENQRVHLRLKWTHHTSGSLHWDDSNCGGRLHVTDDETEAVYISGENFTEVMEFSVQVKDRETDAVIAYCTIFVDPDWTKGDPDDVDEQVGLQEIIWKYTDSGGEERTHTFVLTPTQMISADTRYHMSSVNAGLTSSTTVLGINFAHPAFKEPEKDEARKGFDQVKQRVVLDEVCLRIAEVVVPANATAATLITERSKILATFMKGLEN